MNIIVTSEKSFTASQRISVINDAGKTIDIATLYGAVELDRMTSYNFTILNAELYNANKEAIQQVVNEFMAAIRAKIDEFGGLQF